MRLQLPALCRKSSTGGALPSGLISSCSRTFSSYPCDHWRLQRRISPLYTYNGKKRLLHARAPSRTVTAFLHPLRSLCTAPPFLVESPMKRQEKGDTSLCGRPPACLCSPSWIVQMANKLLSTCGALPKKANIIATSLVAFVVVIVVALLITSPTLRPQNTHSSVAATAFTVPSKPQTVYAHVHVMRTGGSTLNHRMASHFDNVCGNKGYSLDYYQAVQAKKRGLEPRLTRSIPEVMDEIGTARPLSSLATPIHLV